MISLIKTDSLLSVPLQFGSIMNKHHFLDKRSSHTRIARNNFIQKLHFVKFLLTKIT